MEPGPDPRPPDCTCDGDGLELVSSVPRVGALPELYTYRCEVCGHVETVETKPGEGKPKPPSAAT